MKTIDSNESMGGGPYRVAVTNAGTALVDGLGDSDQLAGSTNLKSIAAARDAAMGLTNDGTLIPAGTDADTGAPAQAPAGLTNVVQVVPNYDKFVALKADGTIVVFSSSGGTDTTGLSGVFTSITTDRAGMSIAGLKADGTVVYRSGGNAPIVVTTDATQIAMGWDHITGGDSDFDHLYVQHRDGNVDGTIISGGSELSGPIPVPALKGATSITANTTGVVGLMPTA